MTVTEQQFDTRLKEIEEKVGKHRQQGKALEDQELARLFEECGWTQERIAGRMGKTQGWVQKRLCFGRFLRINPDGINRPDLTERAFRGHWKHAKGKSEADRFRAVAEALAGCAVTSKPHALTTKPNYVESVRVILADGKWHKKEAVLAELEGRHQGAPPASLEQAVTNATRPHKGKRMETRTKGGATHCRLIDVPPDPTVAAASALYEQVKPLIEELAVLGRQHRAAATPGEVLKIAVRMQRLFEAACERDTADVRQ